MNKTISTIYRQLGVIEGAIVGVEDPAYDVVCMAVNEIAGQLEALYTIASENARLSRLNTELETQMRRMVANQCKCDCDWRQEDGTA